MKNLPAKDGEYPYWDYDELIASMEVESLVEVSDDDYQGDTRLLLRDGSRYGLLTFGWGSCSGCDALQDCRTIGEATQLRDELWSQVHWEPDAASMAAYFKAKDWAATYMNGPMTEAFVLRSTDALAAR